MTKPPIPAASISDEWIANCREAVNQREGVPIRGYGMSIEVWSINLKAWIPLTLPGGGFTFESVEDRDSVLARLEGQ